MMATPARCGLLRALSFISSVISVSFFGPSISFVNAELKITRPAKDELVLPFHEVTGQVSLPRSNVFVFVRKMQAVSPLYGEDLPRGPEEGNSWIACIPPLPAATDGSWKTRCDFPNPSETGKWYEIVAISPAGKQNYRRGDRISHAEFLDIQGQRSDTVWVTGVVRSEGGWWSAILRYGVPLFLSIFLVHVLSRERIKAILKSLRTVVDFLKTIPS
jgi:hypothetical protein